MRKFGCGRFLLTPDLRANPTISQMCLGHSCPTCETKRGDSLSVLSRSICKWLYFKRIEGVKKKRHLGTLIA